MTFLSSILNESKKHNYPFDHWEYNNARRSINEIVNADIPDLSEHNFHMMEQAIDNGAAEFREGIAEAAKH